MVSRGRFGKITMCAPGWSCDSTRLASSRMRRFARFRCTAGPNFLPTTTAICVAAVPLGATTILKYVVGTRRPMRFARLMSALRRKNSVLSDPDRATVPYALRWQQGIMTCGPAKSRSPQDTTHPLQGNAPQHSRIESCKGSVPDTEARDIGASERIARERAPNGKASALQAQPRTALRTPTGNDFPATLGAHSLPKPMLALPLEVRRLLIGKRHLTVSFAGQSSG